MSERKTTNGLTEHELFEKLNQPFDLDDIKWKPQTVNYRAKTAMVVAHADPRAYIDKLNAAVGPGGWRQEFQLIVTPFTKFIKGKKAWKDQPATEDKLVPGNKVLAVCTVTIDGIGSHSSTGDEDASDENAVTSAEAQAFKRACMQFGLGRYLYDLPKQTVKYDIDGGGLQETPSMPAWATPTVTCEECTKEIVTSEFQGKDYPPNVIIARSKEKYNKKLCFDCMRKRADEAKAAAGGRLADKS